MDCVEEVLCYVDREFRFPLRIKLNRLQRKINEFKHENPLMYEYFICLIIIILSFLFGFLLDYLFNPNN